MVEYQSESDFTFSGISIRPRQGIAVSTVTFIVVPMGSIVNKHLIYNERSIGPRRVPCGTTYTIKIGSNIVQLSRPDFDFLVYIFSSYRMLFILPLIAFHESLPPKNSHNSTDTQDSRKISKPKSCSKQPWFDSSTPPHKQLRLGNTNATLESLQKPTDNIRRNG